MTNVRDQYTVKVTVSSKQEEDMGVGLQRRVTDVCLRLGRTRE